MINNILLRSAFLILLFFSSLIIQSKDIKKETEGDRRAKGIESQADRKFIRQDFDEAMAIYEKAFSYPLSAEYGGALHLKVGRLYLTLLDYAAATPHYESAMAMASELFSSTDVCNYLDALRFSGQKMKAIGVARRYAYRDAYHSDQRYQNILHALNYEGGFLPIGTPEFTVKGMDNANTPNSEFWVGVKAGEYFYASSKSRFHDPSKKFYHRSNYFSLDESSEYSIKNEGNTKKSLLDMIPTSLQNGPMSFSQNMTKMVVTQIHYGKGDGIGMTAQGLNTFQTRLYYSDYDQKRKGWSSFKEAFPQKEGSSYSHPFIFNNDRSLLFASDAPGGFGGYDIYVAHWNDRTGTWGDPINLGSQVNTEGDEISPGLFNNELIFSSNGHVGFGGYDVYGITYEEGQAVAGSLVHFDYPINTVHNDFSLLHIDENKGYIVSDRKLASKDDIFYFERNTGGERKKQMLFGMTESKAVSNGSINLIREERKINIPLREVLPGSQFVENVLSLYFDFNSYKLEKEGLQALNTWYKTADLSKIDTLIVEGYADEIGGQQYNLALSEKRALEVSSWLQDQNITLKLMVQGKGQIPADIDFSDLFPGYSRELSSSSLYKSLPLVNRIQLNREARRVDIKAITK
ncbi:OmpA family protein [Dysgonomonas sp. Marseille-P4677]|uniref:OmpA family protein n=1 Tax=Dysgonomonas sp. Marseille-P4677 TaxID=2364790 RepID=UPI0019112E50|nr:OmpA family protein [Dysgonomonas sp. Marseille-P4677]MBK5719717.1 OmpA family protein [Dysgonomonas sp. Marseille-P4677]